MNASSIEHGSQSLKQKSALLVASILCSGALASAEPPGRGTERGARKARPVLADSWRNAQHNIRRDFSEARSTVQRDFGKVRNNVRREAERFRHEVNRRRPRNFQFVHILDALFGRPQEPAIPVPYAHSNRDQANGYYYDEPVPQADERNPQWERDQEPRSGRHTQRFDHRYETPQQGEPTQKRNPMREHQESRRPPTPGQSETIQPEEKSIFRVTPDPSSTPATNATKESTSIPLADNLPASPELQVETKPRSRKKEPLRKKQDSYPYGLPVPGKPGMVYSPYIEDSGKYVDVRKIPAGTLVKDPYTDKFFKVP